MNGRGDSDASINEPWQEGFPLSVTFGTYLNMIHRDDCVTSQKGAVQELQIRIQLPFFLVASGMNTATERRCYAARWMWGGPENGHRAQKVMMQD